MTRSTISLLAFTFAIAAAAMAAPVQAQPVAAASAPAVPAANAGNDAMTTGEVRKIDAANGKITLRHGEIRNLDMPPMTMVFRVADPALVAGVKPGDRVVFRAEKIDGALVVTALRPAP